MASAKGRIALPEWTECPQKNGRDPLGMQTSSISWYQELVPGIGNVTPRIRYYGLYAWLCDRYARTIGDTNPRSWQRFVRRAEALYALIAARKGDQTGVAGINWANRTLESHESGRIKFADDAEPDSKTRYLQQAWGVFGAAYSGQLYTIGVLNNADGHDIPVAGPEFGDDLAKAFSDSLADLPSRFLNIIQDGWVPAEDLDILAPMLPSAIPAQSTERDLYQRVLFAEAGLSRPPDVSRRMSLLLILAIAERLNRVPTVPDIRWYLYAGHGPNGIPLAMGSTELDAQRLRWWMYQANDLLHIAYETLLKYLLDLLEAFPGGVSMRSLIDQAVALVQQSANQWPADWLSLLDASVPVEDAASDEPTSDKSLCTAVLHATGPGKFCGPEDAWAALRLLATLHNRMIDGGEILADELRKMRPEPFHSLRSEIRFLESRLDEDFSKFLGTLIEERIIYRHLWVAMNKLRYQGDYTFLMEVDDGRVVIRGKDGPVFTNPRLGPATAFLCDIYLIDGNGLTDLGRSALDAA